MYARNTQIRFGGPITPVVKRLMVINAVIFIIKEIAEMTKLFPVTAIFGLSSGFTDSLMVWQLFTYMFLHANLFHLLFNLLGLWMFAGELEDLWGSSRFLKYYLYSGIGAGVCIATLNLFFPGGITVGASGAIFAILLAYGITWPNREALLFLIIPVKMKYLVLGFGLIELYSMLQSMAGRPGSISHIAHLGGLLFGYIIYRYQNQKKTPDFQRKQSKNEKTGLFSNNLKKIRIKKKQKEIETRIKAKNIIDELLEKIAKSGMSSLSPEEKKKLEWARKNYYPEGNDTLH